MEAARMMERLSGEYGIRSEEELDEAVSPMPGIDLGILLSRMERKEANGKKRRKFWSQ